MAKKVDEFVQHILDQLAPIGAVTARAMFGGWMLSLDGNGLGMVNNGILYLKVDDEVRAAFVDAGGEPFGYFHKTKSAMVYMHGYATIPEGDVDDRHAFLGWARLAAGASRRAAAGKTGKTGKTDKKKSTVMKSSTKKKTAAKKSASTSTTAPRKAAKMKAATKTF